MTKSFNHIILIVDDEENVGQAISRLVRRMGVQSVYANSGPAALEVLNTSNAPISLIISDQRMPGMEGSAFLEKAKELVPETVRFLITGYADIHSVTSAVNQGAVHRFITKPWDNEELSSMIRSGLEYYEVIEKGRYFFTLAKKQNKQLYSLNMELKKKVGRHKQNFLERKKQIEDLKIKLEKGVQKQNHLNEIESLLKKQQILCPEKILPFYASLLHELYSRFKDLATRRGFEMPIVYKKEGSETLGSD